MSDCTATSKDFRCDCFGVYDTTICYECIYNGRSNKEHKDEHISYLDAVNKLFEYLCESESKQSAFTTIHYLQEHMHVLPDCIEQCQECEDLFDACSEGYYLNEDYELEDGSPLPDEYHGHWCDVCVPNIEFKIP